MKKHFLLSLTFVGSVTSCALALDLTPQQMVTDVEGPPVPRYFFQDNGHRLSFRIDSKMTVSGGAQGAVFAFQDIGSAKMKLTASPFPPGFVLDDKTAETYRASARSFLPAQAAQIEMEREEAGTVAINGWTSQTYTFTYSVGGLACRRTITFLNLSPQEQIVLDVCASAADYEKAYARSYRVLNSIAEMQAVPKTGPT